MAHHRPTSQKLKKHWVRIWLSTKKSVNPTNLWKNSVHLENSLQKSCHNRKTHNYQKVKSVCLLNRSWKFGHHFSLGGESVQGMLLTLIRSNFWWCFIIHLQCSIVWHSFYPFYLVRLIHPYVKKNVSVKQNKYFISIIDWR